MHSQYNYSHFFGHMLTYSYQMSKNIDDLYQSVMILA